ncbi:MAG: S1 family peptidase [Spirulinaceae cyanobacterium RM2_2_10]|nr:S1 family peptidase [Spirulinaceae cyanobacterium SM2_1_0]NJO19585.1 S1 family peptidase [Spirulinaceae cyanobacterium RM2_2_10]
MSRFPVFVGLTSLIAAIAPAAQAFELAAPQPLYTTAGAPAAAIVAPGSGYDGVVRLNLDWATCSGSLLSTGAHILTAAHCLPRASSGAADFFAQAQFNLTTGFAFRTVSQFFLPAPWTGDWGFEAWRGYDLAILELSASAPAAAERYELYRDRDELGRVADKVGYGRSGTGASGDTLWSGTKRAGQNRYDALGNRFTSRAGDRLLIYDFDSGLAANDRLGSDLGLGAAEVMAAPGDSGGPSFIDGLLAGITSWRSGGSFYDVDSQTNSSFGELGGDTRVSAHTDWIDGILNHWWLAQTSATPATSIPEPGLGLGLLGLGAWLWRNRRRVSHSD